MRLHRLGPLPLLLVALGCRGVEPAPEDLDGLMHWFWRHYEDGDDESLIEGLRNAHTALDANHLEEPVQGSLTTLDTEDAALVGLGDHDPSRAPGLFLARDFTCKLSALERLLYALDQGETHPDAYDSYTRTYTSSLDDYKARQTPFLAWDVDYVTTLTGTTYSSHIEGGLRYVPELDDGEPRSGPLLLARTFMPAPAVFEGESGYALDQDYQIELFYAPGRQRIVHLYGLWREGVFTLGWDMTNEYVQRLILDRMSDWDDETEAACD
jgi:hypothetical protein